ncbi:sugar-transfer associated ATP-grasp domain-containing protein [Pseudomonas sp. C11]|uniref:sugar-transfer associated ATP-grasp domain-containing protein n=1 Tax=Pseudomonas sp. C11 TaxID=3075550 RepID=UPI002AFDDF0B|nr:sugar-transfer associated ATP-grasp domain-containing protein [Pseudomonas sp. C11]
MMLKRFWHRSPLDGLGWRGCADVATQRMRTSAAARWGARYPFAGGVLLRILGRLLWLLVALEQVLILARALSLRGTATARLYSECLMTGAAPLEAYVWRALYGCSHPLPVRSANLVFACLGGPEGHALLADKLASTEHLRSHGCAVAPVHGTLSSPMDDLAWLEDAALASDLFLKPRRGSGGRDAFSLRKRGAGWRLNGREVSATALLARLSQITQQGDILVQSELLAARELADLAASGRAPVLRISTASLPNSSAFVHSAMLTIAVPGGNPHNFLNGSLYAVVNLATGCLSQAVSLAAPGVRHGQLGCNGAQIEGRSLPGFAAALDMTLKAAALVPPLPLIHWDLILTDTGPVILEGNSMGNWILASLPGYMRLEACELVPLLACWEPTE